MWKKWTVQSIVWGNWHCCLKNKSAGSIPPTVHHNKSQMQNRSHEKESLNIHYESTKWLVENRIIVLGLTYQWKRWAEVINTKFTEKVIELAPKHKKYTQSHK